MQGAKNDIEARIMAISEVHITIIQRLYDELEAFQAILKISKNLWLILELQLEKITKLVFSSTISKEEAAFNADRFINIYGALYTIIRVTGDKFMLNEAFASLRTLIEHFYISIKEEKRTDVHIFFITRVFEGVFPFLMFYETDYSIIFSLVSYFLHEDDRDLVVNFNKCDFFETKYEREGFMFEKIKYDNSRDDKLLVQNFFDMLYELPACYMYHNNDENKTGASKKNFAEHEVKSLIANLPLIFGIDADYFKINKVQMLIFSVEGANIKDNFEFFNSIHKVLLRIKIDENLRGNLDNLNINFDKFVDLLYKERMPSEEAFYIDLDKFYLFFKFVAAFYYGKEKDKITIPLLEDKFFSYADEILRELKFDIFKDFIKSLHSDTFDPDGKNDLGIDYTLNQFTFIKDFNNMQLSNKIIGKILSHEYEENS